MKILTLIGLLFATVTVQAGSPISFTSPTTNSGNAYLLSTNRASVYSIELTCATAGSVQLYDMDSVSLPFSGTNYTNAAYTVRTCYPTNYVTSFIGLSGYTNYATNVGTWCITSTNAAATNTLPVMQSFVVAGGTYAVYNQEALYSRGICATASSNVSIVIYYRTGQ